MASLQQGEKQLFEKFWEGTFRAVATPRLGSTIMTKITSRTKPLASTDVLRCLALPTDVTPSEEPHLVRQSHNANSCERQKDSLEDNTQKSRSLSWGAESPPPPSKGKKKKKKSARKKRRRSPSYSVSPPPKKKKKKSSKKRKRNRISSKKKRHSSSSPKRKRKEGRKHKKHSRSRPQKSRRHHCHSSSGSSTIHSPSESYRSRHRLRSTFHDESRKGRPGRKRHSSKKTSHRDEAELLAGSPFLGCTLPNNYFLSTTELISDSRSATGLFKKTACQLGNQIKENGDTHEYDSGNATSSPPSIQTSAPRSKGSQESKGEAPDGFSQAFSPGKTSSVSSPDSGNSLHSYSSQTKGTVLEVPSPSPRDLCKDQNGEPWPSLEPLEKKKDDIVSPPFSSSPLQPCPRNISPSSRSSLDSSHSGPFHHKVRRRSSSSPSCCSSKSRFSSRSPSYTPKSCKRATGSRNSRSRRSPSYSQYRAGRGREQDHSYGSSGKESQRPQGRRRGKQCYSPMRKRRRNSPSHLEARRITSARKRPIPYYRPSPSSSSSPSRSSVYSSGYSCLGYSPARSRSYSSDRTSSCNRSWSSYAKSSRSRSSGGRSRARSSSSSRSSSDDSASVGSYDSLQRL